MKSLTLSGLSGYLSGMISDGKIDEWLAQEEGKTLEFKENARSLTGIVKTVLSFANTAGGTVILGVEDGAKRVVGLANVLEDELRVANAIASRVEPLLTPALRMITYQGKDLLILQVAHQPAPYYLGSEGKEKGTYVRFGSSNRQADWSRINELERLAENRTFDSSPNIHAELEDLDWKLAEDLFHERKKKFTRSTARSLELLINYQGIDVPTHGSLLLFAKDVSKDPIVRCARFETTSWTEIIDQLDIHAPLVSVQDQALQFIRRHTSLGWKIRGMHREDVPEYPPEAVREALRNALVHADYALTGATTRIAIFPDRMEITNPGSLLPGMTLDEALSGMSHLRNRVIGRVFHQLGLIESWGSGLRRMAEECEENGHPFPKFEELGNFFRVTLYPRSQAKPRQPTKAWQPQLFNYLQEHRQITVIEAAELWSVSKPTARNRLKKMIESGELAERSAGTYDPKKVFVLRRS